jgi:hypothetical protein
MKKNNFVQHRFVFKLLLVVMFVCWTAGCATIIKQNTQTLQINSEPSDAKITIYDVRTGNQVLVAQTPYLATLQRGESYFKKGQYKVLIEKEGYDKKEILLEGNPNGWYIFGNILLGGLIGWFIVDPITGAMWTLEPEAINEKLIKTQEPATSSNSLNILFCEKSMLPEEIVKRMKPVQP